MVKSLVDQLAANIDHAVGADAKAEAQAKLGIGFAQLGRLQESKEILERLRLESKNSAPTRLAIRLIVLEGIIWYYDSRSLDSFDRVHRANILARAGNAIDLATESAVWLAHLAFNFERYDTLAFATKTVLENFDNIDDALRARICLVVADAKQFLGYWQTASEWYSLARIFSRRVHDHAVIAGIEYNRLVMGLGRMRIDRILMISPTDLGYRSWLTELGSVERIQEAFGANALQELTHLCQALLCQASGDFGGALRALGEIRAAEAAERCGMTDALLELEITWCRVKSGGSLESGDSHLPCLEEIEKLSSNEQLVALSILEDLSGSGDGVPNIQRARLLKNQAIDRCLETMSEMKLGVECADLFFNEVRRKAMIKPELN